MCEQFLSCFEELVEENSSIKNKSITLKGFMHLMKAKLIILFRDNIYENSKKIIKKIIKNIIKQKI